MEVAHLSLRDFRNYQRLELDLSPATTLLYGPNAAGKTSLLEALFYLATTRSPRVGLDRDLVRWDAQAEAGAPPFARVAANLHRDGALVRLEVVVQRHTDEEGQPTNGASKLIRIDRRPARALDLVGQLRVVIFTPTDLNLVDGSPNERRRYLDITLSQLDATYVRTLAHYQKIVQQRNSLLRTWRERRRPQRTVDDELAFWDHELATSGAYLLTERLRAVADLQALVGPLYQLISGSSDLLTIDYLPSLDLDLSWNVGSLEQQLIAGLRTVRADELARGQTLLGPHRDDLAFRVGKINLGRYGSRGQQRSVALALKLAEVDLMRTRAGDAPVLLLDDVLSELDAQRRAHLLEAIRRPNQQTLLSATDLSDFGVEFLASITRLRVEDGRVYPA